MWDIRYSREVRNYIFDSYPYTADVWMALKSLPNRANGFPPGNYRELESNVILWRVAGHEIIYERIPAQNRLYCTMMKPEG